MQELKPLKVRLVSVSNGKVKTNAQKAYLLLKATLQNDHEKIVQFIKNFRDHNGDLKFSQTEKTNDEILKMFYSGKERDSEPNGVLDIRISTWYNPFSRAVARTYKGSLNLQINTAKHSLNPYDLLVTIVHEYCHMVGMEHSFYKEYEYSEIEGFNVNLWDYSAPYAISRAIGRLAKSNNGNLDVMVPEEPYEPKPSRLSRFFSWFRRLF